ncbi:Secreted effector protein PipB2 [Andreprevotia sp. IGB-42]|uniref:DUF2169 domain-containing protein n=1 Tax=Andreprevotia sp. IGB-42 TaxID=2497473 RepID=UPI001356A6C0|nr:DUF2169 domain-containing protein [Andreprevotia sp. IGB-42]KAF0815291.1 Secreted effector protein PipB2 [Andreprevotia sp. IGB-42]
MKAIKPLSLGLLHRPYRIGDEYRFVVSALGFFRLGTQNERFLIDNLQWPLVAKALPAGQMLDEVMPKPAGEVLLAGSAHAPGGEPVKTMTVSMQLGKLQKSLRIVGKRTWAYGLLPWYRISAPAPFSSMPIDYAHAFGGPGLKANPAGMGYSGNPFAAFWGSNTGVLPNIELPGRPAIRHWRRYAPAGFGAIPLSWTPRMTLLRAMPRPDEKQLTATSPLPGLAARVDRSLFQMAPTDQQLPGDVGSGEPYRLTGMHPQQPVIEGQLPALAARAFIQRRGSDAAEEVPLQCDTVWFFPDLLLGVMIWHGEAAISDSLAQDVQTVMVAYERAGSPKPLAHYQQALARRTNPATAGHDAFNESQLAAEYSPAEQARRASAQAMVQATETARQQAVLDEHTADFWASSGLQPPPGYVPPIIPAPPLPLPNPLQIRERDFDVGALIDAARAVGNTLQQQAAVQLADARLQLGKLAPPPVPTVREQQQQALARASVAAGDLQPVPAALPAQLQQVLAQARQYQPSQPGLQPLAVSPARLDSAAAQLPALQRQARQMAPEGNKAAAALDQVVAAWLGQQLALWHAGGALLAGRDVAGARLAGMDFRGADLREIMLDYADLSGTCFAGADLRRAVLTGARLDGADFSGARLDGANLNLSHGQAIRFDGATLSGAQADQARWPAARLGGCKLDRWRATGIDLSGAMLNGSDLTAALLLQAIAPHSSWQEARLDKTVLLRANLSGADCRGAVLNRAMLVEAQLAGSDWSGASFIATVGNGAKTDWRGALLRGARGERSNWQGAAMAGADLRGANLQRCDFSYTDLTGATLSNGCFAGSLFLATVLADCVADHADFFQALLHQARCNGADLRHASFVQADLSEADFTRAQLDAILLEPARSIAR